MVKGDILQKIRMEESNNSNLNLAFQVVIEVYLSEKKGRLYFI